MINRLTIKGIPLSLLAPTFVIASLAAIPLLYLATGTIGADQESWDWLLRWNTLQIVGRSLLLVFTVTSMTIIISLPIAFLTDRTNLGFKKPIEIISLLPLVIPSYIGAYLYMSAVGPGGFIDKFIATPLNIQTPTNAYGFPAAVITLSLLNYPYVLLTVKSALTQMDRSLEESGRLLGLSGLKVLAKVVIPQLKPAIASGGLLVALYTLSDFGAVTLLKYKTFTWSIHAQYEGAFNRHTASLLSIALVILASGLILTESISRNLTKYYRTSSGSPKLQSRFQLGFWKWPITTACLIFLALTTILPITILLFWVLRGISQGISFPILFASTINSVGLATLTATAALIAVTPVVFLVTKHKNIFSQLIEKLCYTGYALPSLVVALSFVYLGSKYGGALYQSFLILILACVILTLPAALSTVRTRMLQISPRMEESSISLGRSPLKSALTVTIPALKPGLLMGAIIVFLLTMKELPAILILSPLDFTTLTTDIWTYATEGLFSQAAAPSLTLIGISSIAVSILLWKANIINN